MPECSSHFHGAPDRSVDRPRLQLRFSRRRHERMATRRPTMVCVGSSARNRQVLTYQHRRKTGCIPRQGLGQHLEPIQSYCLLNNLPPLTILVVKETTGLPGVGFIAAQDIPLTQMQVFAHDWFARKAPMPDELQDATERRPSNGDPNACAGVNKLKVTRTVYNFKTRWDFNSDLPIFQNFLLAQKP